MNTNTGGPAFPQHGWSKDPEVLRRMKDQGGMTLLDWMAGQALAAVVADSLAFNLRMIEAGEHPAIKESDVAKQAYVYAAAMLAEKARREADHSGDVNKMVQGTTAAANERWAKFQDGIRIAFSPTGGWSAEIREGSIGYGENISDAIANLRARWEEKNVVPNHSPDAGKMGELEAANRELVEALDTLTLVVGITPLAGNKEAVQEVMDSARAILAKHKGVA